MHALGKKHANRPLYVYLRIYIHVYVSQVCLHAYTHKYHSSTHAIASFWKHEHTHTCTSAYIQIYMQVTRQLHLAFSSRMQLGYFDHFELHLLFVKVRRLGSSQTSIRRVEAQWAWACWLTIPALMTRVTYLQLYIALVCVWCACKR